MPLQTRSPAGDTTSTAHKASVATWPVRPWLGPASLTITTIAWAWTIRDAWRLRTVVADYESMHGQAQLSHVPWPAHLQTFHDDLLAVGADYFYPFGGGVIVGVGLSWIGAAVLATTPASKTRRPLLGIGLMSLIVQLLIFSETLGTYVTITD